jgi:hypothetical protein
MNDTLSAMITFDTFDRQLSKYSLREPQIGDNVATDPATIIQKLKASKAHGHSVRNSVRSNGKFAIDRKKTLKTDTWTVTRNEPN